MLDKILVPLDGSVLADAILTHIVALTRINGAQATLLHVLETNTKLAQSGRTQVDPVEWRLRKIEAQSYLQEIGQRLERFDLATEQVVLEGRSAADRIVEYAQKEEFDLVALSTHGQGGLSGWNVSSVPNKVISRIRRSTLLIPAHRTVNNFRSHGELESIQYRRILVPLDGSRRAECILPLAEALARRHEAELILIHVVTPPEMIRRMPLNAEEQALAEKLVARNHAEATAYFDQLRTRLTSAPAAHVLMEEDAGRALHKFVESEAIDLVLLAAHGQSCHNGRAYGHLAVSLIELGGVPIYLHQDLKTDEMAPLYAERMLNTQAPLIHYRINIPDYVAN